MIAHPAHEATSSHRCRAIAVTGGKGGVGKSQIALNLAVALAQQGQAVCLLDGNLGLGSLDLLCGLSGYWNLSHVVAGARRLEEVVLEGPAGIHLIPGGSGIADLVDCPPAVRRQLLDQLQSLEQHHDVLVIDTGSGLNDLVRQFALAADDVLVVTTPEPPSIADAYSTIKVLHSQNPGDSHPWASSLGRVHVIVNQVDSSEQARQVLERIHHTTRLFLKMHIGLAAGAPRDPAVAAAVLQRRPFVELFPASPAARAVNQLADHLRTSANAASGAGSYFSRLCPRLERSAA